MSAVEERRDYGGDPEDAENGIFPKAPRHALSRLEYVCYLVDNSRVLGCEAGGQQGLLWSRV